MSSSSFPPSAPSKVSRVGSTAATSNLDDAPYLVSCLLPACETDGQGRYRVWLRPTFVTNVRGLLDDSEVRRALREQPMVSENSGSWAEAETKLAEMSSVMSQAFGEDIARVRSIVDRTKSAKTAGVVDVRFFPDHTAAERLNGSTLTLGPSTSTQETKSKDGYYWIFPDARRQLQ